MHTQSSAYLRNPVLVSNQRIGEGVACVMADGGSLITPCDFTSVVPPN
jgi:hypothetical protein